jgi:hypothetical protein
MKIIITVYAEDTTLDYAYIHLERSDLNQLLEAREYFQMVRSKQPALVKLTLDNMSVWFFQFQEDEDFEETEEGPGILTEGQRAIMQELGFVVVPEDFEIDLDKADTLESEFCHLDEEGVFWTGFAGAVQAETHLIPWAKLISWLSAT